MITVVLPAYNEALALPRLLDRMASIPERLGGEGLRVVVVDDGSTDGTAEVATGRSGLPVRVVSHARNEGLGAAVDTGLRAALQDAAGDDIVVTMDADDTHPPDVIPALVGALRSGADVAIASRYRPGGGSTGVPAARRALSRGMGLLFGAVYPVPGARDYSCGYRAYRADTLREGYDRWADAFVSEADFTCTVDLLLKLHLLGAQVAEVPLALRYDRKPGPSKMRPLRTAARTLALLARRRMGRFD